MKRFGDNMLVILPKLSPYETRRVYLSLAYMNTVSFFRKRFAVEPHVISSAGSALIVPQLDNVKLVQAIHPADFDFFCYYVTPLGKQDILYMDAFDAAASAVSLKRLSVEMRLIDVIGREAAAVHHIARNHYDLVVDFEHPRKSVYRLSPKSTKFYLRVSTVNLTVKAFLKRKPIDLSALLEYSGAHKPLGTWDEGGLRNAAS